MTAGPSGRRAPKKSKTLAPTRLKIDVNGDRRLTEKIILEVQATARRLGLEIDNVAVIRKASAPRKRRKPASGRKVRARA